MLNLFFYLIELPKNLRYQSIVVLEHIFEISHQKLLQQKCTVTNATWLDAFTAAGYSLSFPCFAASWWILLLRISTYVIIKLIISNRDCYLLYVESKFK